MTTHVLLCKRTANLLLGWRISFMDYEKTIFREDMFAFFHGWILEHPDAGPVKWFLSKKWVDEYFEMLGEL